MAADAARTLAPDAIPVARPRRRAQARGVPKRSVAGGVAWIVFVAVLLTGIVAINVAVLRLNLRLDRLGEERTQLRTENTQLRQQAAQGAVPQTIRAQAKLQGYHWSGWNQTRYVELGPTSR
jgi:hypothetical protein